MPDAGSQRKTQIVIVGGGAGGLELARKLGARYGRKNHDIILVDRNRTHIWKPLLHEVAAGSLDANLDEVGYGGHAARWGYRFFYGALESIDREARVITTAPLMDADGEEVLDRHRIRYDYLVLAIGGVSNDFGIPGVREHAMFLEHRTQADTFRHKLLNACFRANLHRAEGGAASKVRICIVGGGATGVELSAELFNAAKGLQNYGLEVFDESALQVTLLEAGPRILPALDEDLAATAQAELEALGAEVRPSTQVVKVTPKAVHTKDGGTVEADLILWAAGVRGAHGVEAMSDLELSRLGQFVVRPTLQTTMDDRIFSLGDCASCLLPGEERPIPPRAQSAHQMAARVFRNLNRMMAGQAPEAFRYNDHGSLVSLSRFAAVGSLMGNLVGGRMAVEGRLARMAYRSLYRMHILAIHGWLKGSVLIVMGHVNQIVRPRLKLH
ncbi:NAD(P)/FAD-dependent oxidoreductase [Jannaschia ovalis]|uniref:NAD(P)/FAD-dependent oxidoreductase n=1 Tax=Jannaschia ovalis TaxID=3038773 RepID=A0ABY8LDE8_9RHOB|nr:NAD(P)/FAD-dependent oxidoreductase [Jannaschia sp. GRR-S6-38]WGH79346.1 NAD(P)/FAD-dependent oxidoreductase [Jannaschia sp. GRR-S6-38]